MTETPQTKVIQVAITMDPGLKKKYSRLAMEMDMNFSQLVRHALCKIAKKKEKHRSRPHP